MMQESKNMKEVTQIWNEFEEGKNYQREIGVTTKMPLYSRFAEGEHWKTANDDNINMPRIVINATGMAIDTKVGSILANPVKLNFIPDDPEMELEKITRFVEFILKEMDIEARNEEAVRNGLEKGNLVYHVFWDENAIGKTGVVEGGLRCRVLNPLNVIVHDFTERDIQKQKYIIVESEEDVATVRSWCAKKSLRNKIESDEYTAHRTGRESKEGGITTVLTKYFRIDGEVYFQKSTRNVVLHDPTPLNFEITKEMMKKKLEQLRKEKEKLGFVDLEELLSDAKESNLPSEPFSKKKKRVRFRYYPIIMDSFNKRDGSIIGRSEVENIKELQKAINISASFAMMNQQNFAFPKYVAKQNALRSPFISNDPSEIIIDRTPLGNKGIDILTPPQLTAESLALASNFVELTRTITKTSDIVTGDMINKDLSGSAISLLQQEGNKQTNVYKKVLWRCMEMLGKIIMQYFMYYDERAFTYEIPRKELMESGRTNPIVTDIFNGTDYSDKTFTILIEAGDGTQFSEVQTVNLLLQLFNGGHIDALTVIDMIPQNILPNKAKLKESIEIREQSEIIQLRKAVNEQQEELHQLSQYTKDVEAGMKEFAKQAKEAQQVAGALQTEFTQKIGMANGEIEKLIKEMIKSEESKSKEKTS